MNISGSEKCSMKIWGAGKGFTGYANVMTQHLYTCRRLADT